MTPPLGGSELAFQELTSRISSLVKEEVNILLSNCYFETIKKNKINILWQQLSYDQENIKNISNPNFVKDIDAIVFVSHWQYEKFKKIYDVPSHKSIVIHNATRTFSRNEKPKDNKLKLIYTSMPNRGLEILLDVVQQLERDDIELDVYSSTIIYGSEFDNKYKNLFKPIFDHARMIPNVFIKGYGTNEEIRSALEKSHIMLYPCTFEETSCMSVIEALAAGCKVACNNLGALPETCGTWADIVTYDNDKQKTIKKFKKLLIQTLDNYWSEETQSKLQDQVQYYNNYWSWDTRIIQWNKLFNRLMEMKYGRN